MSRKRAYNLQLWRGLIQKRLASGKSVRVWCEETGYTKDTYYYWLEQIRNEDFDKEVQNLPTPTAQVQQTGVSTPAPAMMTDLSRECAFVELPVPASVTTAVDAGAAAARPAAVIRKDGMQIEIFRDTKEDFLRLLLTVLKDA